MILSKDRLVPIALTLIILSSGTLMILSSSRESAVMDELAHIPAGYGYVKYLDYRLNPEHPPLLKALSALPLLFLDNIKFPADHKSWAEDVNGQWETGAEFLYKSGNDADLIIFLSRIFPIILSLGREKENRAYALGLFYQFSPAAIRAFRCNGLWRLFFPFLGLFYPV